MLDNLKNADVVLVSCSPRRKQLLEQLGLHFRTVESGFDEKQPEGMLDGEELTLFLSRCKVECFKEQMTANTLLISADTIVMADGVILGKPADKTEAVKMLRKLSGKTHRVITGVTLKTLKAVDSFTCTTEVRFATLSDEETDYYIDHFAPYDKAGSYGIQEWIGLIGAESIKGCFYNVMGLPLPMLYQKLKKIKPER